MNSEKIRNLLKKVKRHFIMLQENNRWGRQHH